MEGEQEKEAWEGERVVPTREELVSLSVFVQLDGQYAMITSASLYSELTALGWRSMLKQEQATIDRVGIRP